MINKKILYMDYLSLHHQDDLASVIATDPESEDILCF